MDCGGTGGRAPQCLLQRKDSRVKRAVAFFKHLGHKTSVKGKVVWPIFSDKAREMADTSRQAPQDAKYTVKEQRPTEIDAGAEVFEMARCSISSSPPRYELPSHMSRGEVPEHDFIDLRKTLHPLEMPDRLSHTIQHELSPSEEHTEQLGKLSHPSLREPEIDPSIIQSVIMPPVDEPSMTNLVSPTSSAWQSVFQGDISPITPITEAYPYTWGSIDSVIDQAVQAKMDQQFFMPTDLIPDAVYSGYTLAGESRAIPSTNIDKASSRTLSKGHRGTTDAAARPTKAKPICYLPKDRHRLWTDILKSGPDTPSEHHTSSSHAEHTLSSPSSASIHGNSSVASEDLDEMALLVQELSEIVSIINNDWIQRLSCPVLAVQCSKIPTSMLFEHGFDALERIFQGKMAHTFTEVFAMMHIACASASMSHSEECTYCWADLFADMLQWRHSIPDESERLLFEEVISEISSSLGFITKPLAEHDASTDSLLEALKCGPVMENCKAFLNGKESSNTCSRHRFFS